MTGHRRQNLEQHKGTATRTLMRAAFVAGVLVLSAAPARACLWDSDTIGMERRRFPGANELIAGKFLKHSRDYYLDRIEDRRSRLANDDGAVPEGDALKARLALLDDLAVALDKTGEPKEAIKIMREALALAPERYETHANLGTHLIHSGQLQEGLKHLRKAIAINPDAHFGRERYQINVAEYVIERRSAKTVWAWQPEDEAAYPQETIEARTETTPLLPLCGAVEAVIRSQGGDMLAPPGEGPTPPGGGFVHWLSKRDPSAALDTLEGLQKAIKGVLGMMRFGHHDSPILLEVLGDLMLSTSPARRAIDGKLLAARAYLMAARAEGLSEEVRAHYRTIAEQSLGMQTLPGLGTTSISLERVEQDLEAELVEAKAFTDAIAEQERAWLADGIDVEQRFAEVYYEAPALEANDGLLDRARAWSPAVFYTFLTMLFAVLVWCVVRTVKLMILRLIFGASPGESSDSESKSAQD